MSPRLPRITAAEFLRALVRAGWIEHRQVGSHVQLKHPSLPGRITIPCHAGITLKPKTLTSALKQAGMTVADLQRLL